MKSGGDLNLIIDSNNNTNTAALIVEKDTQTRGNGTELFRVEENGNVGIGTASPGNKLDVNGGIDANTLNTGQGDNELYAMNQNVRTTDTVTFSSITGNGSGLPH